MRDFIVERARALGFHRVALLPMTGPRRYQAYRDWVDHDKHGSMAYMAAPEHLRARTHIQELLPEAQTLVIVALAYDHRPATVPTDVPDAADVPDARDLAHIRHRVGVARTRDAASDLADARNRRRSVSAHSDGGDEDVRPEAAGRSGRSRRGGDGCGLAPTSRSEPPIRGVVARYARGADYHHVIKRRLYALAEDLGHFLGRAVAARPCTDSAPVLERDYAEQAGLGFTAKNTMLITPGLGSYTVLGELLLDVAAAATDDPPMTQRCGSCRACLDACPTHAFDAAYQLDARRCISYATIEHRGSIPHDIRSAMGTMIFGCDICQDVCPFNARAPARNIPDPELTTSDPERGAPDLLALLALGSNQRRRYVAGTALRRVDRVQLARNICVALGNARDPRALDPVAARLHDDPSPVVRGHAAWALGQLGDLRARAALERALEREPDPAVRREIQSALGACCP